MLLEVALNLSPLPKNLALTFSNKSPNLKLCHVKPHGVLPELLKTLRAFSSSLERVVFSSPVAF